MTLPRPYYQDDACTIYHGDCREIMPGLEPVNAVVTDPPFGISWSRATWEDASKDYPELIGWLVSEANRVVPEGFVFVFQAMPNCGRFHEWFPEGWRLFAACKNFAQIRPTGVWHSWDPVVFWRNGPNSGPNSVTVNRDYCVGNVAGLFGEKAEHPCPKPLDTMRHIIALAAPDNGVVLDPFCGSGTTLRAAKDLRRKAIGIEIEERYCEIAAKRCAQEVLALDARAALAADEGRKA
jgi:site-specific DNA-methyltransferase (adenine-specific)